MCHVLGALSTWAFDRNGVLVGASGGGYALMLAHLADIILVSSCYSLDSCYLYLNWEMNLSD